MKTLHSPLRRPTRRSTRGFALLEALVALLLFSFGVLGVVGLQATMVKATTSAKGRTDAANLAHQLVGTIWIDRANVAKYASASCSTHAPCADWTARLATTLPAATSTVTVDATTGAVAVQVSWTPPNEGTHTLSTATVVTP